MTTQYLEIFFSAANIVWWYFFSKFTDFMDSFFFVLRKKNNQLTSLHVIHHGIMPMVCWIFMKYAGEVIPPSSCFSTWVSMWWCTSIIWCLAWGHRFRNISGGNVTSQVNIIMCITYQFLDTKSHYFRNATATVCHILYSWMYSLIYDLWLSKRRNIFHSLPWCAVFQPFYKLLYSVLHQESFIEISKKSIT